MDISSAKKENSLEFFKNPTVTRDISSAMPQSRLLRKRKAVNYEEKDESSEHTDTDDGFQSESSYDPQGSSSISAPNKKKSGKEEVKETSMSSSSSCLTEEWESKEEMSNVEKMMKYARYGDENNPGTNSFEKIEERTLFFLKLHKPGRYTKHGKILDPMHYAVLPKEIWDKMYKDNKPTWKTTWKKATANIRNTKKTANQEFKEGCLEAVYLSVSNNAIGKLKRFRGHKGLNLGTLVLIYSGVNPKDENGEYVIRKGCDFQVDHMTNNPAINIPEELRFIQNPFNDMFRGNGESGITGCIVIGLSFHSRFGKGNKLELSQEMVELGYEGNQTCTIMMKENESEEEVKKRAKMKKREAHDAATKQLEHLEEPFLKYTYKDKVKLKYQFHLPLHGYFEKYKLELSQEMDNLGYNGCAMTDEDTRALAVKKKKEAGIAVINQLKKLQPWKFKAYKQGCGAKSCVEYSIEDDLRQLFA